MYTIEIPKTKEKNLPKLWKKEEKDRRMKHAPLVSFDNKARVEYITGFRKRKLERRKRGHAHEALKVRKAKREATKERREDRHRRVKAALGESAAASVARTREADAPRALETVEYHDERLVEQWGDVVTVETTLGIAAADDPFAPTS